MAEVEDVAAASAGLPENLAGSLLDHLARRQQDRGVEVALDSTPDADPPPAFVEGHPPIQADQIGTGARYRLQQCGGASPEVDARDAQWLDRGKDGAGVRGNPGLVVVGGQRADPAVEQLNSARA